MNNQLHQELKGVNLSVQGGEILGTVQETEVVEHRILVPPNVSGLITEIYDGEFDPDA